MFALPRTYPMRDCGEARAHTAEVRNARRTEDRLHLGIGSGASRVVEENYRLVGSPPAGGGAGPFQGVDEVAAAARGAVDREDDRADGVIGSQYLDDVAEALGVETEAPGPRGGRKGRPQARDRRLRKRLQEQREIGGLVRDERSLAAR